MIPDGIARSGSGIREAIEIAHSSPVRELISAAIGIGDGAIEMPCFRPDREYGAGFGVHAMATGALVLVGNLVLEIARRAIFGHELQRDDIATAHQASFGLGFVPDIGQGDPAILAMDQQAGFDQAHRFHRQAVVADAFGLVLFAQHRAVFAARVVERLADDGADGEIERGIGCVVRRCAGRHPYRAQLVRVVGEQGRVEIVGQYALVQLQPAIGHAQQVPFGQRGRHAIGMKLHRGKCRRLTAGGQQQCRQACHQTTQHGVPLSRDQDRWRAAWATGNRTARCPCSGCGSRRGRRR